MEKILRWESLINTNMGIDGIPHQHISIESLEEGLKEVLEMKKQLVERLVFEDNEEKQQEINEEIERYVDAEKRIIEKIKEFRKDEDLIDKRAQ